MRSLRRNIGWLVLAGFVSAQGAVWVAAHHATLEDDAACEGIGGPRLVGPHHQAGVQFEETNLPNPIEHCALCHLHRGVRVAMLARLTGFTPTSYRVSAPVEPIRVPALVVRSSVPSRGPPSLFT